MLDRIVQWSSPPVGWRLLIVPITVAITLSTVILNDIILFTKGMLRKIILYSTAPGIYEDLFAGKYLHRDISMRKCTICNNRFWTIGESKVCRKISCYIEDRGRR